MQQADTLRIPAHKRPSFLNRSAAAGFGVGFLLGPIGAAAGMIAGGILGKLEMQNDLTEGKAVSPPSLLGKEALKDAMIGLGIGMLVGALLAGGIFALGTSLAAASGASAAIPQIYALTAGGVYYASAAIGAVRGLFHGKQRMQHEWQHALAYAASSGEDIHGQQPAKEVEEKVKSPYVDSVTAPEYEQLQNSIGTRMAEQRSIASTARHLGRDT